MTVDNIIFFIVFWILILVLPTIIIYSIRSVKKAVNEKHKTTEDLLKEIHRNTADLSLRVTIVETRMEERGIEHPQNMKRRPGRPRKIEIEQK